MKDRIEEITKHYYTGNHLSSTQLVTDGTGEAVQQVEYAPFGEVVNEYNIDWSSGQVPDFKFNGKELDEESGMYYFEARYQSPPVFISRDPLFEKYPTLSPYSYCANSPLNFIDPTGKIVRISGAAANATFQQLNKSTSLKLKMIDGVVTAKGKAKTDADKLLLLAITDENVIVDINATNSGHTEDGKWFVGGAFEGSEICVDDGKVYTRQTINPNMAKIIDDFYELGEGVTTLHEVLESYIGGVDNPGAGRPLKSANGQVNNPADMQAYENAHSKAQDADPRHKSTIMVLDGSTYPGKIYIKNGWDRKLINTIIKTDPEQ
ncbi:MAG: RHS repeat-associated core domain-containing protein [Bacteroidales bacterium]|nr:RHS repeat-associated core domain-containing protein [Bacteroidales bacterium]